MKRLLPILLLALALLPQGVAARYWTSAQHYGQVLHQDIEFDADANELTVFDMLDELFEDVESEHTYSISSFGFGAEEGLEGESRVKNDDKRLDFITVRRFILFCSLKIYC